MQENFAAAKRARDKAREDKASAEACAAAGRGTAPASRVGADSVEGAAGPSTPCFRAVTSRNPQHAANAGLVQPTGMSAAQAESGSLFTSIAESVASSILQGFKGAQTTPVFEGGAAGGGSAPASRMGACDVEGVTMQEGDAAGKNGNAPQTRMSHVE